MMDIEVMTTTLLRYETIFLVAVDNSNESNGNNNYY